MKKSIFIFIFSFFFSLTHAGWYGNTAVPYSAYSDGVTKTQCPADGDTFGGYASGYSTDWAVTNSAASLTPTPVLNSYSLNSGLTNAINVATSGTMYCLKWDGYLPLNPTSLTLSSVQNSDTSSCVYSSGVYYCKTSSASLNYNWAGASDLGGSSLKDYQIVFQRASDAAWIYYPQVTGSIANASLSSLVQGTYYTWIRSRDNALNEAASFFQGPSVVIDITPPTVTDDYIYDNIWTNGVSKTITLSPLDTGGSGLATTKWCEGTTCNPSTGTVGTTITKFADYNNTIRYQTWDIAGNASVIGEVIVKLDNTIPNPSSDITNSNQTDQLAIDNYNYNFSVGVNGGSPINLVEYSYEQYNNNDTFTFGSSGVGSVSQPWNLSLVDNDSTINDGNRIYNFRITKICDVATNCWTGTQTYNHNVYANFTAMTNDATYTSAKKEVTSNPFTSTLIADGISKTLTITLKDKYGNKIIPVSNGGHTRTIDFLFNVGNTLYLDQYKKSGPFSVFYGISTDGSFSNYIINGNNNFPSQTSTNGNYDFGFKVYTPTNLAYNKAFGNCTINGITYEVQDNLFTSSPSIVNNSNDITFKFNPLYSTTFSGEQKEGLIPGTVQSGSLQLTKNTSALDSNLRVYLEYGSGAQASTFPNLEMKVGISSPPSVLAIKGHQSSLPASGNYLDNTFAGLKSFFTKLTQSGAISSGLQNTYLSSHIRYNLDGHDVVYNSDIIGRSNYWDSTGSGNTVQSGVKVVGITSTKSSSQITTDQFSTDVSIIGNIYKASLKRDIVEGAYSFVKGVTVNNGSPSPQVLNLSDFSSVSNGVKLDNNSVLYFGSSSAYYKVTVGNISNLSVSGKKTLLVIGGDVYIKRNILYSNNSDNLGIIALKDGNGNGGNILIDPAVTRIEATLFAEESLLSSNGIVVYDGDTSQATLKNQLFIYGSVFSENTIGGSNKTTAECPYYVASSDCNTIEKAQAYDLNYLRRYFVYDATGDGIGPGDVAANGGENYKTPTLGNPNSYDKNFYQYALYPVVIEYNPMLSTNPPPLFSK